MGRKKSTETAAATTHNRAPTEKSVQNYIRKLAKQPELLESALAGMPEGDNDGLFAVAAFFRAEADSRAAGAKQALIEKAKQYGLTPDDLA